MTNIIKAQFYQLFHSISTYIIIAVSFIVIVFSFIVEEMDPKTLCGSSFAVTFAEMYAGFMPMIIMLFTAIICAGDMKDKTINYEMLTGTKRSVVYCGRLVVSVMVSVIFSFVYMAVPTMIVSAVCGWGHAMPLSDYVMRMGSAVFPIVRLTLFYAMCSFILTKPMIVCAVGYVFSFLEMIGSMMAEELFSGSILPLYLLSFHSLSKALCPANFGYGFEDGVDIMVVKDLMTTPLAVHIIVSGLIGTAVFGALGYMAFRKKDMG